MPSVWISIGMLVASACSLPRRDGEPCDDRYDCESESCEGNICVESRCSCGPADCPTIGSVRGNCRSGFLCVHHNGSSIFGGDGEDVCHVSCDGGCPAGWKCSSGRNYCEYDGPDVTISYMPERPRAHELVRFEAIVDPPAEGTFEWTFGAGGSPVKGPVVERDFPAGRSSVSLTADFDEGRTKFVSRNVEVCAIQGEACTDFLACCDGLTCAAGGVCQ